MISDILAKKMDFFSIGTNDLTQYTLAADRQNPDMACYFEGQNKSVMRLINYVVGNAHKNGLWVGVCGELGADTSLTETLLAIGIDELSAAPRAILPLRKKVTETDAAASRAAILAEILN